MFSFFKRKKNQNNAEPAAEPAQTGAAPDAQSVSPPAEQAPSLPETQPQAVGTHPPNRPATQPAANPADTETGLPGQDNPDAPADEGHIRPSENETAPAAESHARPSENEAAPAAESHIRPSENEAAPAAESHTRPSENETVPADESHTRPSENEAAPAAETIPAPYSNETAGSLKQPDTPAAAAMPAPAAAAADAGEPAKTGWAARLKKGLAKSRDQMAKSLAGVFGGGQIDEDLYEELETVLITGDMGMEATDYLMKDVRRRVSLRGLKDGSELRGALKDAVYDLIKPLEQPLAVPDSGQPFVIMLAGINGAGKTTSIGKLAKYFQSQGKSVLLAAGDTFRAAAREQLQEWGARNGVTVISQTTGDSAAVCFDAVEAAKARGIDIVLADTAGRLPTQLHLMEEIKKVKRVLQKSLPDAPHEIILVLDANIGQNAIGQVAAFDDALGLTGLIVTKLDGTAKGGILAALAGNRPIPVRYIGVGEGIDDLRPFSARAFIDALLD